ncbi:MAG: oxidoreductase [Candidatus Omnitrophica bacterium]|nr:oxidoreductase [Candidatus Omnitrophota bacterium]
MTQTIDAKIKEVIQRTGNVKSVRLELPEIAEYKAGQFGCVFLKTEPVCHRYLSISSSPTEEGYLEFTKKLRGSDFASGFLKLKPGDVVGVQYPMGKFTLEDNGMPEKCAFLSGGIGITPIRSIVKSAVDKNLGIDMVLIYANQTVRDIVFHDDLEKMQEVYPKFRLAHVLCEPAPDFKCSVGLINSRVIKNEIPDYSERKFFLCGPPPMVEGMKKILSEELKLPQEQIVTENFAGY